MAGLKFTFTGDNQDVLKKINQIQAELKKVYNKKNTKIDLNAGIDFSLLGENFKRLDQQSREAFDNMSKDAQKYVKEIQQNILSLQQVEKMQAGLNSLYEDGDIDLNTYIQSQARLTVLHEELAKGINESRAALEAETTTTKIAEDSIAGLHAKVLMLTTDYMNLSKAQREGTEGAALLKNLQETQTQLDNASLSMDKYASGAKTKFDSLGMSVTQIARELPSLAMGPQMFFLAISNNLGPFQDALAAARKEYQEMTAAGKTATPVWKQLLSSLKGSGPILAVVTTLFVTFGDDIIKWVGTLFKAKKAVDDLKESQKAFNEALNEGAKNAQQDITRLQLLYKAAVDTARGQEERNKAVSALQKEYPDYFRNLDAEAIKNGTAQQSYENLAASILKAAQARVVESRIAENQGKVIDLEPQIDTEYKQIDELREKYEDLQKTIKKVERQTADPTALRGNQRLTALRQEATGIMAEIQEREEKIADVRTEIFKINKQSQELANSISAIDLTFDKGGETDTGTGTKAINAYSDQLHRIAELRSKSSRERIRLEVELANQEEQARIDAMQDGFEKEERQRKLNNKIELESIERQKQDYINKVVDIQKQIFEAEENAKSSKDKNYKKQTFNPSSVSVDTSVFDTIESETLKKQANETTEYYNDILSKYQDYITKRLNVEKQFNADREKLQKSGASDAQLNELEYQRTETLNSIDKEFAMREDSFQSWANRIADLSLKELQRLLVEAERELERMEFITPNSSGLATQRAKVNTLKQQISDANNKNTTSPDKRSVKDWQDLYKTLSKVEKEFNEIGDTIGGAAGEIMSAAGSISSSTLQMIDGIVTLANSSSTAMSETSKAASTAIQTVEKASVILAIVGAALQVATKIVNLFKQDDGIAAYEKAKETYESYIQVLDKVIDKQLELADTLSGKNARAAYQEAIDLIQKQSDAAKELGKAYLNSGASKGFLGIGSKASRGKKEVEDMSAEGWTQAAKALGMSVQQFKNAMGGRMTGLFDLTEEQLVDLQKYAPLFWAQLDEDTRNYTNQIVDGVEQIMEVLEREMENATGVSWDSFSDDILEALYDVEKGAKDIFDDMSEYMRKAMIKAMYVKQYEPELRKWYEMWASYMDNGVISDDEQRQLDALKENIINGAMNEADRINKAWGSSSSSSQEASSKGFATMSQETADELNGRFTALQISGEESKNQLVLLNQMTNALLNVNEAGNATLNDMLYQQVLTNSYLEDIAKYTKVLQDMKADLAAVKTNTARL